MRVSYLKKRLEKMDDNAEVEATFTEEYMFSGDLKRRQSEPALVKGVSIEGDKIRLLCGKVGEEK